jgi:hypothetical protein
MVADWEGEDKHMAKGGMKPGEKAPASGQYKILGPRGGDTGTERTVTRGAPLRPTPEPGQKYRLADRTKNRAGQGWPVFPPQGPPLMRMD